MMRDQQEIFPIELSELKRKVQEMMDTGHRISQISCAVLRDGQYEISYSFELDYKYKSLRIVVANNQVELESVSDIYFPAFLYENEIHDLFGLKFKGLALDYNGKFYKLSVPTPFAAANVANAEKKSEV